MALAKCEPFDARTATIACELRDLGLHQVVGIDERDLGTIPEGKNVHFVEPGDGSRISEEEHSCFPDTSYAFLELTSQSDVGEFTENVYNLHMLRDTSDLDCRNA